MEKGVAFETKVLAGFSAAVLMVASLVTTTWTVTENAASASRSVAGTHEVLNQLSRVKSDALSIELASQNFRLTGDESLLVERDAAIAAREASLERIRRLAAQNPLQLERFAQLREVIDARLKVAREIERISKTAGMAAATRYAATASLRASRDRMHQILADMESEENRLLAIRSENDAKAGRRVVINNTVAAVLLGIMLLITYVMIRRQARNMEASRQALAESEEQLATTLRSIGDAVLSTDTDGRIVRMNPLAEQMTGWPLEEARGRALDEVFRVVDEVSRQPIKSPLAAALSSDVVVAPAGGYMLLVSRDGAETPVANNAAPIRDRNGRLTGMVLVFRDESIDRQARRTVRAQNEWLERRLAEETAELRESQGHLLNIISNVPAMIAFVDAQQRYVYANQQYVERFSKEAIGGRTVGEVLGEQRYAIASPLIDRALAGESLSYDWEPFPGVWQVINYVPRFNEAGKVAGYYVLGADITDRKLAEQQILKLNEELRLHLQKLEHVTRALRTLSAGNRTMLHASDEPDLVDSMCKAIVAAGGYRMACVWYRPVQAGEPLEPVAQAGHIGGMPALYRIKEMGGGNPDASTAVAAAIRTGEPRVVHRLQDHAGYIPWRAETAVYGSCIASPLRVGGKVIGALAIYSARDDDFSDDEVALLTESSDDMAFGIETFRARIEQEKIKQAMHRLTHYDNVTKLPNENQFMQNVNAAIDASVSDGRGFALLQADIERLREINEVLGFRHGDQMLKLFAERLCLIAPADAIVCRLRADEFAILLPASQAGDALALARQLDAALAEPFPVADLKIEVEARIGIAVFPDHGPTAYELFHHMDIAVNYARTRNLRHAVFEFAYSHGLTARLQMVSELRLAIESGHLALYLQPKVELRSGKVCGAEALVRWQHATRGMIAPDEFIGLAEHTGLIKPLTNWVIDAAVQLNVEWKKQGCELPIAINLSAPSLRDDSLLEKVHGMQAVLAGIPGMLEMELTESMLMEDSNYALKVLHGLRDAGIQLYIDDFGTGYSSLSYLQTLPVDTIKIDQSFVEHMLESSDSAAIVRSIIDLSHDLGRKVVAEGVETREHVERLSAYGCDSAQGYYFAVPMPPAEFQVWLATYRQELAARTERQDGSS